MFRLLRLVTAEAH